MARYEEVTRLWKVQNDEENEIIKMSVFYLAPQFCLLGIMEGLTVDGLEEFMNTPVAESMKRYGPAFNEFVFGIGKSSSIFWILTFNYWLRNFSYSQPWRPLRRLRTRLYLHLQREDDNKTVPTTHVSVIKLLRLSF